MSKVDTVFLVGVYTGSQDREYYEETIDELSQLAKTAGVVVDEVYIQNLKRPNTATYIGKGKLKEIAGKAKSHKVKTLIFNSNLSPSQSRNISDITHCNVVDRTELILDIFAIHARTRQSKLQIELAQLEYSYTKLKNMWKHLSRIKGGIGFRGPGETQIEVDRREIRKRIALLKDKIDDINRNSITQRSKRKNITSISLVGYTNAGKSTLFNNLTHSERYTADQLFATLDPLTRSIHLPSGEKVVLTDTIGFIRNIPHRLISSFHSTLLDVLDADLLLHVVDVSHPNLMEYIDSVLSVLKEIGVDDKNIFTVFNKIDLMDGKFFAFLKKQLKRDFPDSIFISSKSGENQDKLISTIEEFLEKSNPEITFDIPMELTNLIEFIRKKGEVFDEKIINEKNIHLIRVKISRQLCPSIKKQINDHNFLKSINI